MLLMLKDLDLGHYGYLKETKTIMFLLMCPLLSESSLFDGIYFHSDCSHILA